MKFGLVGSQAPQEACKSVSAHADDKSCGNSSLVQLKVIKGKELTFSLLTNIIAALLKMKEGYMALSASIKLKPNPQEVLDVDRAQKAQSVKGYAMHTTPFSIAASVCMHTLVHIGTWAYKCTYTRSRMSKDA